MLLNMVCQTFTGRYLVSRYRQVAKSINDGGLRRLVYISLALLLDVVIGVMVAYVVKKQFSTHHIISMVLNGMDTVIFYLRELIAWLMGAPVGLKLNSVLSSALGKFFLYHIHLWVTFLHILAPLVSEAEEPSTIISFLSYLGVCLQLSLALDVFNVVTFHVHCFYAYARRLFITESRGLTSLWRLFRGIKFNQLRNRHDTTYNSQDQLFVGTVAFTILLFLYPTTLMYFVIFKTLEITVCSINTVISKVIKTLSMIEQS